MVDQFISRPTVPNEDAAGEGPQADEALAMHEREPGAQPPYGQPTSAYTWDAEDAGSRGSSMKWIVGGAALLALGIAGWLFARSRRRPSRRERAAEAMRRQLAAAAEAASSLEGVDVDALRDRVEHVMPSRREIERGAKRARERATRASRPGRLRRMLPF